MGNYFWVIYYYHARARNNFHLEMSRDWKFLASRDTDCACAFTSVIFTIYTNCVIVTCFLSFIYHFYYIQDYINQRLSVHVKWLWNYSRQGSWHELPSSLACAECCGKRFNIRAYGSWIHCTHRGMRVIPTWFHKQRRAIPSNAKRRRKMGWMIARREMRATRFSARMPKYSPQEIQRKMK